MEEQKEKKQANPTSGYLLMIVGVIRVVLFVIRGSEWNVVRIVKLAFSVVVIAYGLWVVIRSSKK